MAQFRTPNGAFLVETTTAQRRLPDGTFVVSTVSGVTNYTLTADSGSFTLTGNAANLVFSRTITAETVSFSITGSDAGLVYTPAGGVNYSLTADSGSFSLTGNALNIVISLNITADSVSYVLLGSDAGLTYTPAGSTNYTLISDSASFTLVGNISNLTYTPASTGCLTTSDIPSIVSAIMTYEIEAGITFEEFMRILLAVAAGKTDITGTTVIFRDIADTKARVTASMTGSERTTVTLDGA